MCRAGRPKTSARRLRSATRTTGCCYTAPAPRSARRSKIICGRCNEPGPRRHWIPDCRTECQGKLMSRATRREWIGLAVLALPCVVYAMDLTVLNLAVPALTADLHPSGTQLLWIVDIYGFTLAASLITMGNLGDRIGRRRLLLIGAVVFGLMSIVAAYATSAPMLIAARALLGVAGATIAPSTLSLIRTMFEDARQRTFAIGVWITSFSVGAAAGPVLGGLLLEQFWWGSVFLLSVPVMGLLVAVVPHRGRGIRAADAGRIPRPRCGTPRPLQRCPLAG